MRNLITIIYTVIGTVLTSAGIAAPLNDAIRGETTTFCFTATAAGLTALAAGVATIIYAARRR